MLGVMPPIVNPIVLLLDTVSCIELEVFFVTLPKARYDTGANVGAESVPVPRSAIVEDGVLALLVTTRPPPELAPCAVGMNSTMTWQLVPPTSPPDKVLHPSPPAGITNSPVVLTGLIVIVSGDELGFVSVAAIGALVDPTRVFGNAMAGERLSTPAIPVPVRFTVWGLLGAPEGIVTVPVKVPTALAVKVTWTMHVLPAPSGWLEQPSDEIAKFGGIPGPEFVVVKIWPMLIGDPVVFCTVMVLAGVVVPVTG